MKPLPVQQLRQLVAHHLSVCPDSLQLTPVSTGRFNTSLYVDGCQRPLMLRIAPPDDPDHVLFYEYRMMRQEPGLHALLHQRTEAPLPEIVAHDFSHRLIDRDYLLMERLPGVPLSCARAGMNLARTLRDVGQALRQTHDITGRNYGYVGPHRPMPPQATWVEAFMLMWDHLIDDIQRCKGYSREEADHMRGLLRRYLVLFDRKVPASLLHMDVWAENILAGPVGELTGLIDWDRALWGDPEIEFAVLDYCGISKPAFWEGYGRPRDLSPPAQTRRIFYLLYEIQKYIFIERVRRRSPQAAARYKARSFELAAQLK